MKKNFNTIYGLFYEDKPIYEIDFFDTDIFNNIKRKRFSAKFYLTKGYAEGALKQLPEYINKEKITIVEYKLFNKGEQKK